MRVPRCRPRRGHGHDGPRGRRHRHRRRARSTPSPAGGAPFYEPGLPELLDEALADRPAAFDRDIADGRGLRRALRLRRHAAASRARTPPTCATSTPRSTRSPHLVADGDLVVGKSTVPVGTAARLAASGSRDADAGRRARLEPRVPARGLRRPGHACTPTGSSTACRPAPPATAAATLLDEVYAAIVADGRPAIVTDLATAELVKVAANSFLATKISFINAMAELCEATGADVTHAGRRDRARRAHRPQVPQRRLGFGGGCLPKDIRAFMARAGELRRRARRSRFLREVDAINLRRRDRAWSTSPARVLGGSIAGARIAVLGAAFKPDSDDVRDSPALDVADQLRRRGAPRSSSPTRRPCENARRRCAAT